MDLVNKPFDADEFYEAFEGDAASSSSGRRAQGVPVTPPSTVSPVHDDRTLRMIRGSVRAYPLTVLSGIPGTGKGMTVASIMREIGSDPQAAGFDADHDPGWPRRVEIVPDDETSRRDIVGSLMPTSGGGFRWAEGVVLQALRDDAWLYLDELNRGDLDRILGPVLSWLAGETVQIGETSDEKDAVPILLGWDDAQARSGVRDIERDGQVVAKCYYAGRDFRAIGALNPKDAQRVFQIGRALSRRMKMVPVPPLTKGDFTSMLEGRYPDAPEQLLSDVVKLYAEHLKNPTTRLGAAAFLEMSKYVLESLADLDVLPEEADPQLLADLTAEAYLIGIGGELKRIPPASREPLGQSDAIRSAIGEEGWDWIMSQLDDLL
jgi:hypothetical protein